jgi:hypothetical protein
LVSELGSNRAGSYLKEPIVTEPGDVRLHVGEQVVHILLELQLPACAAAMINTIKFLSRSLCCWHLTSRNVFFFK